MLMKARMSTREVLEELLSERILLLDGSMGALIYSRQPAEEDYRGSRFLHHPVPLKNCTEVMVLTQPGIIEDIHRAYAGITMPNDASVALHTKFGFRQAGYFTEQGRKFERYWDVAWFEKEM